MSETLEAGRELDSLVAEKVMKVPFRRRGIWHKNPIRCPHYSTDIAAAWAAVEKLGPPEWVTLIYSKTDKYWECSLNSDAEFSTAPTAPLAICRAALAAVQSASTSITS